MFGTGNLASYPSVQEAQTLGGSGSLPLYSQLMEIPTLIQETSHVTDGDHCMKPYEMQRKWILVESCPT